MNLWNQVKKVEGISMLTKKWWIKKKKYKYLIYTARIRVAVSSNIVVPMEFSVIFAVKSHERWNNQKGQEKNELHKISGLIFLHYDILKFKQ